MRAHRAWKRRARPLNADVGRTRHRGTHGPIDRFVTFIFVTFIGSAAPGPQMGR